MKRAIILGMDGGTFLYVCSHWEMYRYPRAHSYVLT